MTTLTYSEILRLQALHRKAVAGLAHSSWKTVRGQFATDSSGTYRLLTDDEIEIITGERPKSETPEERIVALQAAYHGLVKSIALILEREKVGNIERERKIEDVRRELKAMEGCQEYWCKRATELAVEVERVSGRLREIPPMPELLSEYLGENPHPPGSYVEQGRHILGLRAVLKACGLEPKD